MPDKTLWHVIIATKESCIADNIKIAVKHWPRISAIVTVVESLLELTAIKLGNPFQIVLLDELLPGITSRQMLTDVIKSMLPSKVLLLTSSLDKLFIKQMISITAACIPRCKPTEVYKDAINGIITKGGYSLYEFTKLISSDQKNAIQNAVLTHRQIEILIHWVKEFSLEKSGTELGIKPKTIKRQRNNINHRIQKAGFQSYIAFAQQNALIIE